MIDKNVHTLENLGHSNGPFPLSDSDVFSMDSMYINKTISTLR